MTEEHPPSVRRRRGKGVPPAGPQPAWPTDAEHVEAGDVDFEAVACVLANTCRWGGRSRRFLSLAQHALTCSEEIEALDGIDDEDRRALALHGLLGCARAVWLGDEDAVSPSSARAAARASAHGTRIDRAVREAAGLDPEPTEEWVEVLRFVDRMTDAAERRDLGAGGGKAPFPPLQRTVRPLAPEQAAERWLARFRELAGRPHGGAASDGTGGAGEDR